MNIIGLQGSRNQNGNCLVSGRGEGRARPHDGKAIGCYPCPPMVLHPPNTMRAITLNLHLLPLNSGGNLKWSGALTVTNTILS